MRTAEIELAGRKYPAAFSLRVLGNLEARTGKPAGDALDALLSADTLNVTDTVWLLSQMLAAGAAATGSMQRTPTEDELLDSLALDDLHALAASVLATVHTARPLVQVEQEAENVKKKSVIRTLFG